MNTLKVLVVDDEESLRKLFKQRLADEGYAVATAGSGKEAVRLLSQEYFDVIVTDLKMPEGDGIMVLEAARDEHPDTEVIIMTAFASIDSAIDAMRKGAADYLCKPFDFDELIMRLDKIARKKELTRQLLSVEHDKDTGIQSLKEIALHLHQKCLKAEKILNKKDMDIEVRVQKAINILSS
jgi:two-component system, OmpR family, response regulator